MKIQHAKPVDIPVEITMSQREAELLWALLRSIAISDADNLINEHDNNISASHSEVDKLIDTYVDLYDEFKGGNQ